jgi:hypothetical protein
MPSRSMIAANTAVFRSLDEYCASRLEPLSNAGKPRWVKTTSSGRQFLLHASLISELSFSASVKIARFDIQNRAFFMTSGLDAPACPAPLQAEDLDGGRLTAFLYEVAPAPAASPAQIRNIVEFEDRVSTPNYDGHDCFLLSGLYPKIQVFSAADLPADESSRIFFLICLSDRRRMDQWVDEQLARILDLVADLSPRSIPYEILCRAILDMDPSALFLALYRCLEAL